MAATTEDVGSAKPIQKNINNEAIRLDGKYTVIGIDIDTTGRRLLDEMVQLAAYTPSDKFQQYIMPYMDLNPAARQRHQLRVISIGFYRLLRSMHTMKIIKSKSEIAAIKEFLTWLEQVKAKDLDSQGVILMYYEERKFIPYMILQSFKKYNLLDKFCSIVKFFVNGAKLANAQDAQCLGLRKLSFMLTNELKKSTSGTKTTGSPAAKENGTGDLLKNGRDNFEGSAKVRAKFAYKVAYLLCNKGCDSINNLSKGLVKLVEGIQNYAQPIASDLKELEDQSEILERQNSFRPVFIYHFKATLFHRVRAVKFRIILAERGFDLNALHAIWKEKQKDGLVDVLKDIEEIKATDKAELADLFDSFFDPNKTTLKPTVRNRRDNRRENPVANTTNGGDNTAHENAGGEANKSDSKAGGDKKQQSNSGEVPDSTTKTPNRPNNFRKQQRKRRTAGRNNLTKSKKLPLAANTSTATNVTTAAPMAVVAVN